ncbi:MAG: hypothetical protein A4E49_00655 [Methanosaeta sp. PtaU1.Bin112]|nr:MAG: hypothetical protein A4E49_00655 [Methanosaeta sp. PtaU1.Bin112]
MLEEFRCEGKEKSVNVLGLLGYYDAILEREGLAARMGEIRSLKLGLTLDLLRMVNIAEDLRSSLINSVLSGWEMKGKGMPEGDDEMKRMHSCIEAIREKALMMMNSCSSSNSVQLDVAMMLALPLMPHDLKKDEVSRIHDMLNKAMKDFAARREQGVAPCL